MSKYSLFRGDEFIVSVNYKAEIPQALSKNEQTDIKILASKTLEFKNYIGGIGIGHLTIKLN